MTPSPRPREASNLPSSLHQQLNMYAIAATAAGVGMLALSPPAEGKIVYTPTHKVLIGKGLVALDLNHDGLKDFTLSQTFTNTVVSHYQHSTLNVYPFKNTKNLILGKGIYAAALPAGASIGSARKFRSKNNLMAKLMNPDSSYQWYGPWANGGKGVRNRYLGLKFIIKGKIHFGWARLTVDTANNRITTTLTGYAYETISKKAIIAGKTKGPNESERSNAVLGAPILNPGSLGTLALGWRGLATCRHNCLVAYLKDRNSFLSPGRVQS
jgi:hypothetical protein